MSEQEKSIESIQKKQKKALDVSLTQQSGKKRVRKKTSTRILLALLCIVVAAGVVTGLGYNVRHGQYAAHGYEQNGQYVSDE